MTGTTAPVPGPSVPGVDWAPLAELLLLGLALGAVPVALWVFRTRQLDRAGRLRALTLVTLFLTFDLVVFGAFTRLTDSGLGCPDWPGCYGELSPLGAHQEIAREQAQRPTGPVTFSKAWIEMVHRYWASAVGFLIVVLAVLAWRWRRDIRPHWGASIGVLVWVLVQGAFGALTVTLKLFPAIVTLHLLFGLGLVALLAWQSERLGPRPLGVPAATLRPLRRAWRVLGLLLLLQLALGGWVSTNYAVLICREFPSCQGSYWPDMDFAQGFVLWRELGQNADGSGLTVPALTAIHVVHRLGALVLTLAAVWLARQLWRAQQAGWASVWLALLLLQWGSGVSNVVLGWPLGAALLHSAGAAAWVAAWTLLGARLRPSTGFHAR